MFVKICGITNDEDALLSVALGADALGFNFVPGSPRQVTPADVRAIIQRLPPATTTVGVFRDERQERVVEIVNSVGLTGAQLHGREPASEVTWIRGRLGLLIQAFSAGDPAVVGATAAGADIVMLDGETPGSGRAFDWQLAEGVPTGTRVLLAGGLNALNVGEAIRRVQPWGVDVATGVETEPGSGRKDARRLQAFIEAARRAGEEVEREGGDADAVQPFDWQADGRPA